MLSIKPYYLYLVAGTFLGLLAFFSALKFPFAYGEETKKLQEAYTSYLAGEKATTIAEKERTFNQALLLYSQLESSVQTIEGKAKLQYNLGNSYFQLESYPWAVLHYYRALRLDPNNPQTKHHLDLALAKLGLSTTQVRTSPFINVHNTQLPLHLFFTMTIFLFLFLTLYIWRFQLWMNLPLVLIASSWLLLGTYYGYIRYMTPVEGVLISGSMLYHTPDEPLAKIVDDPLFSGSKVNVLEYTQNGNWAQITTADGRIGFVPKKSLRLI